MIKTGLLYRLFPPYKQVLTGKGSTKHLDHLLSNLAGVDQIVAKGRYIHDQVLIGALVCPLVAAYGLLEDLPPGRKAVSTLNRRIRETIKPLLREAGFSKGNAEAVCYMLFAQYVLNRSLKQGSLPKTLCRKKYFGPGLCLFQIEAFGRNESLPSMFVEAANAQRIELLVPVRSSKKRRSQNHVNRHSKPSVPPPSKNP
jgi:hypothetical protein